MAEELNRTYEPAEVEGRWYQYWLDHDYFKPRDDPDRQPFVVTIPPPNVTGELHMGHALEHVIHDAIIRRKRMQGIPTLCLPGMDHASISTQMKVVDALQKEGIDRRDIGREEFVKRCWDWTDHYGGTILRQLRSLGCSYDWSRQRFTLDDPYVDAVLEAFVRFYDRGWIYRGLRMVNWCPECQTVVSDLEVEFRDLNSHLWHFRYPAVEGSASIVVATTRPETMLGDTAVAVHPEDERYADLVGKQLLLPLMDRPILVVADEQVDREFGTGAVKVTPAHDPNDDEIGQRHDLPYVDVIGKDGCMTDAAGAYAGLTREEARKRVLADLDARGLLVKTEDYAHSVGHHDRCGRILEPLRSEQWFMNMRELADGALKTIREGRVRFTPERFTAAETDWLENIRDWCLSRQLWWGHRIPIYTHAETGEVRAAKESPGPEWAQDEDVLDTWFSSGMWPFATLGWPRETEDLKRFYPTTLMIMGRDILYLWCARMIMLGEEFTGRAPYADVLIHATVLTGEGKRMSKSLGTGVDPMELINRYGADATRFSLAQQVSEGQDIRFKVTWACKNCDHEYQTDDLPDTCANCKEPLETHVVHADQADAARRFCTKIWNLSRFMLMNLDESTPGPQPLEELKRQELELADRWIISRYNATVAAVDDAFERYALGEACHTLYHFVWDELADWYAELVKPRLRDEAAAPLARAILISVLDGVLRLAHPFMPFLTEEIWQRLPEREADTSLCVAEWPQPNDALHDPEAEQAMERVINVTRAIRNLRAELGLPSGQRVNAFVSDDARLERAYVEHSAPCDLLSEAPTERALQARAGEFDIAVPLAGAIDVEAEVAKVEKSLAGLEKEINKREGKLRNEQFLTRAPAEIVERERGVLNDLLEQHKALQARKELITGDGSS